jgi:hypothetical protein
MANEEHLIRLKQGVEAWNQWRAANPAIMPDLSEAPLSRANLSRADLSRANLAEAILTEANLTGADLGGAHLTGAQLIRANLADALLSRANLQLALAVETNFEGANLTGCSVYGLSVWNVKLTGAQQSDLVITAKDEPSTLVITAKDEPVITVDNLEVAQFIYLLLHNEKIRRVIDTITSKAVLILGRFTPERKAVLDAIREALRQRNYLPILFDFEAPASRDLA